MKTFKEFMKEDGMGVAMGAAPTNVVGTGNVAGTGGKGGEPGVNKKKKGQILIQMGKRTPTKV